MYPLPSNLQIPRQLRPPVFPDPVKTQKARLLHIMLLLTMSVMLVYLILILVQPQYTSRWIFVILVIEVVCAVNLILTRRGHLLAASLIMLVTSYLVITGLVWTAGGAQASALYTYLVLVFFAGFLLGAKGGMITGLICILSGVGVVAAESAGMLPPSQIVHTSSERLVNYIYMITCMVAFLALTMTSIQAALKEAHIELEKRRKAETALNELNARLEQLVNERTQQLVLANKELEAFSYSVSHDLRSPLRGMDGFSQLLLEDYAGQLDAAGQDYLARIRGASQRMAQLIDDLLKLSHISNSAVQWNEVDLTGMAQTIISQLRAELPDRQVEFVVPDHLKVQADTNLMWIVMDNLLSNAWKFTHKTTDARIELGLIDSTGTDEPPVYFVGDNGAGFDMAYVDKLFGAFQRLHAPDEFEGTGIGLAIVKRVIQHHGGRVWAEGKINQGATIYFTLAGSSNK